MAVKSEELASEVANKLVNQPANIVAGILQKLGPKELKILLDGAKVIAPVKKRGSGNDDAKKEIAKKAKEDERANQLALSKLKDNISISVQKWVRHLERLKMSSDINIKNSSVIQDVFAPTADLKKLKSDKGEYYLECGKKIVESFGAMEKVVFFSFNFKATLLNYYNFGRFLKEGEYMSSDLAHNLEIIGWPYGTGHAQTCVRVYLFVKRYPNLLLLPHETGFRTYWITHHGPIFRKLLDANPDLFCKPLTKQITIKGRETKQEYITPMEEATETDVKDLDHYEKPEQLASEDIGQLIGKKDEAFAIVAETALGYLEDKLEQAEQQLALEEANIDSMDQDEDALVDAVEHKAKING